MSPRSIVQRLLPWSRPMMKQVCPPDTPPDLLGPLRPIPEIGYEVHRKHRRWPWVVCGVVLLVASYEIRTSALQAWVFSHLAARMTYTLGDGPSPRIAFPTGGPFDERYGYTRIPAFERRLTERGYRVVRQAQLSPLAARLARFDVRPPYPEPAAAGLTIRDRAGALLYDTRAGHAGFGTPTAVPALLADTLGFLEDRRLQALADPQANPVIDWGRLGKASILYAGRQIGLPVPLEGGSTLATQLEKFQHAVGGRTASPVDKLRQMTAASLQAYRAGVDTRPERQQILLEYLNTMPLGAAPGWGEVNGLPDGLLAWFGLTPMQVFAALDSPDPAERAQAYKVTLALLCAARGPSFYLVHQRPALEARIRAYLTLLTDAGILDPAFAARVRPLPLPFVRKAPPPPRLMLQRKAVLHLRGALRQLLGEPNPYVLDRLHLDVASTLDLGLQEAVADLFSRLRDPAYVHAAGLVGEHLLRRGDPADVAYSFLLFERTPAGNLERVHYDTLGRAFDINDAMKMELGSTAKLRTLVHYLELMVGLHGELAGRPQSALRQRAREALDPLTRWAAETLATQPTLALDPFLEQALDRSYSGNPDEMFFTGGGAQTFANFDRSENFRRYSVREGLVQSVNLVYVRLMRDLVRYHAARLPYDPARVLDTPQDPDRRRLLAEIADQESRDVLATAYRDQRDLPPREVERRLLGRHAKDPRYWAMLFYAGHPGATTEALAAWLAERIGPLSPSTLAHLTKAYGNPQLTLADFGFLLGRHPLEVWCAGQLQAEPHLPWSRLVELSTNARRLAAAWLFKTHNRAAQDRRLRIRIEADAFARMTPAWRRLGFPFAHLVPSLATAIGSSADRPDALAELMGILVNDGVRQDRVAIPTLRFAAGTPYETVLARRAGQSERVLPTAVAQAVRPILAAVVREGTARRVAGAFTLDSTALVVGGKTGSGDNRYKTFARGGALKASRAVSRTAAFAFYLGDRYFGVITASVEGPEAGEYEFTSALPVAVLKLLAPAIMRTIEVAPPARVSR